MAALGYVFVGPDLGHRARRARRPRHVGRRHQALHTDAEDVMGRITSADAQPGTKRRFDHVSGHPGHIVEVDEPNDHLATVDVAGVVRRVNIGLLDDDGGSRRRLGADPRRLRDVQDRRG